MEIKKKIHFKGLNGLRGIAALLVLFGHTGHIVFPDSSPQNPLWTFLSGNGDHAVSFFFVLSGFLISYLMLNEIQETGNISVKRFYLKRIFRIWPIYYLVILLVQLVLPGILGIAGMEWKTVSAQSTIYYLIILPNVPYLFFDSGKLFHLWSIGVEEQFYLIWGPLAKWFRRHFLQLCVSIILIKWVALKALELSERSEVSETIFLLLRQFRIEQMCIGGLGAFALFKQREALVNNVLFSKSSQLIAYTMLLFFLCTNPASLSHPILVSTYQVLFVKMGFTLIPLLYLFLLLNVSVNPKALFGMENKVLNHLGTISYGFYVYHVICMVITEFIMKKMGLESGTITYATLFYSFAIIVNVTLSTLSFRYFETPIQKFGQKKFIH